jgi:hypothetical protein
MTAPRALGADLVIATLLFIASAFWGSAHYTRAIGSRNPPRFYQSYFEPAVMTACGRGFLIAQPGHQPPQVRAFLLERSDRFSCDDLPADLKLGTEGLYQRPWRYLLTTVALAWMLLGISWSGLAPLFGVLYGATTAIGFALCRLIVGRTAAVLCAAALCLSPLQRSNLPNLRDYAKAPFTLALLLILIALAIRPWRTRDVLLLSLAYGVVMGVGYGFRTDLLIGIPPLLVTIALFLPDGLHRHVAAKLVAVLLFATGFAAAGWPIIRAVTSAGGCQWHFSLLGLTDPFNDALGVRGGAYGWGHLYKDEYMWATVSSYAGRFRPELGYIEYCSHEYDAASWDYLRRILSTFPADMVTRAYGSVLQVLGLPFHRLSVLSFLGPAAATALVLSAASVALRLGLFALFLLLYFGGHPAIQFLPRHYFVFELVGLLAIAFVIERAVRLGAAMVRDRLQPFVSPDSARRAALCGVIAMSAMLVPLALLRWYQAGRVVPLLKSYADAPASPLRLESQHAGAYHLPVPPAGGTLIDRTAAIGRTRARFVEVRVDSAACKPGTAITFRYDSTFPDLDFSHTVAIARSDAGATRLFEPTFDGFLGIDLSDPAASCRAELLAVDVDRFPLLLPAQLTSGWEQQPQYQRLVWSR